MNPDLFGELPVVIQHSGAYAGAPGSGPQGRTCRDCDHYCRVAHNNGVHRKCGLVRGKWTHGPATDIKAGTPACRLFVEGVTK